MDNPVFSVILFGICIFHRVQAASDSSGEAWNEFTDNFATDIAPLITLFGEQVTKQFLSESTGFLDNIIFGMAPLGILTAVVSAIRVYGWPGLKAFIGRAQEPHGVAEAELCSSTSHDVCELWSEGGICRVFGKPRVLEFIHKLGKEDFYPKLSDSTTEKQVEEPGACNIYRPICFLSGEKCCNKGSHGQTCEEKNADWEEYEARNRGEDENELNFAPYANLSLNIGIRETPWLGLAGVAFFATLLQLSFFVYATIITFHSDDLYDNEAPPDVWAFVLAVAGTIMVVFGMILCSFLIERRSDERRFLDKRCKRADPSIKRKIMNAFTMMFPRTVCTPQDNSAHEGDTTMYWLQPGNQRIGDQQFNAFSHNKAKRTYVTSWKRGHYKDRLGQFRVNSVLVLALVLSVVGFVLQFIGLRGLHGSIPLYQIAATLLMSIIRALLRQRRLGPDDNVLQSDGREIEGNELDWQAMEILKHYHITLNPEGQVKKLWRWRPCEAKNITKESFTVGEDSVEQIKIENVQKIQTISGFRSKDFISDPDAWLTSLAPATEAIRLASHYEDLWEGQPGRNSANPVVMAALIRSRLAYLTSDGITGVQPEWESPAKSVARELQVAIQGLANYVFSGKIHLKDQWRDIVAFTWHTAAAVEMKVNEISYQTAAHAVISFPMFRYKGEWKISKYKLEAVLGLWSWPADRINDTEETNEKVLFVNNEMMQHLYLVLHDHMPAENLKFFLRDTPSNWHEAWLVQKQRLVLRDEANDSTDLNDVKAITMRAKSSRIKLQAQGIFTIFLSRLASIFHIYGSVEREVQATNSSQDSLDLWEGHVKAMTKLFTRSGLGTEEEAFMSIIPVLAQTGHLRPKELTAKRMFQSGLQLRRQKKFSRAEMLFKIMLDDENVATRKDAYREIGEVYRKAYRACQEQWAIEGLEKMERFWESLEPLEGRNGPEVARGDTPGNWPRSTDSQEEHKEVFNRYSSLYAFLRSPEPSPHNDQNIDHMREQVKLLDAKSPDVLEATVRWNLSSLNESEAGNLLIPAVRHSYAELIDDILEENPGLIETMIRGSGWQLSEVFKEGVGLSVIQTLLNIGEIQVNMRHDDLRGETLLSLAVRERRLDIVRWLLKNGASVNAPTRRGNAIFSCIADDSDKPLSTEHTIPFMTLLLDNGVKVNTQFNDETIVKRAVKTGNLNAVEMLIGRGADLKGQYLLNEAARKGNKEIFRKLLAEGLEPRSEVDQKDPQILKFTPMGDFGLPNELLFLHTVKSSTGNALHSAILARQTGMVEMLLKDNNYLDVNTQIDGDLEYAINMAVFLGEEGILELLLKAKPEVDVNKVGKIGSALAVACARKDLSMVKKLLARKAQITSDGHLKSPLVVACLQSSTDIVQEILNKISRQSAYLNEAGVDGLTPLCAAIKKSTVGIVKMLLDRGADANKRGGKEIGDKTPLEFHLSLPNRKGPDNEEITKILQERAEKDKGGPVITAAEIDAIHLSQTERISSGKIDTIHLQGAHTTTIDAHKIDALHANDVRSMTLHISGQISEVHISNTQTLIFNSDEDSQALQTSTRLALEDL